MTHDKAIILAVAVVALFVVQVIVWVAYVQPIIARLRATPSSHLNTPSADRIKGVRAAFVGYKHAIIAFLGSIAVGLPDLLSYLKSADLSGTPLAAYAGLIGVACFVGLMIFHAMGLKTALNADAPQPPVE